MTRCEYLDQLVQWWCKQDLIWLPLGLQFLDGEVCWHVRSQKMINKPQKLNFVLNDCWWQERGPEFLYSDFSSTNGSLHHLGGKHTITNSHTLAVAPSDIFSFALISSYLSTWISLRTGDQLAMLFCVRDLSIFTNNESVPSSESTLSYAVIHVHSKYARQSLFEYSCSFQ